MAKWPVKFGTICSRKMIHDDNNKFDNVGDDDI